LATHRAESLKSYKECLKLYLSFERWVNEPHSRQEVQKSEKLLGDLISLTKQCFPRTDGNGWNLPKMHALAKMPKNMLKFGTANNFCGQTGERALKGIVKDHAQQTLRRPDSFAQPCALREYETNLLRYFFAYGLVKQLQIHKIMQYSTGNYVGISTEKTLLGKASG